MLPSDEIRGSTPQCLGTKKRQVAVGRVIVDRSFGEFDGAGGRAQVGVEVLQPQHSWIV
jgi:hypothetical protein